MIGKYLENFFFFFLLFHVTAFMSIKTLNYFGKSKLPRRVWDSLCYDVFIARLNKKKIYLKTSNPVI